MINNKHEFYLEIYKIIQKQKKRLKKQDWLTFLVKKKLIDETK